MNLMFLVSILGTIAFAVSGVMVAVHKKMDLFGINILGVTTAVGGGAIRDLLIGDTPPVMFRDPIYVLIAIITANVMFLILHQHKKKFSNTVRNLSAEVLFISDTLGLAAFTINGVSIGMENKSHTAFLCVFLGVITGVGGGILRDIMAQEMPAIFVKHIYAVAALIGAILTTLLWNVTSRDVALIVGFLSTIIIRFLAARNHWNLPRIES